MSTLKERLHADVVVHMKDHDKVALNTVRNVLGEIETREKAGKEPVELNDAEITTMLQKEAHKRRETAALYTDAGEADRAAAEIAEAEVIETYLPEPLSAADVEAIVDGAIADMRAAGQELSLSHMSAVMKPVSEKVAGRFDGKAVSDIVRQRLT
ncbi:GatB/YqeY domain-containing protein [Arthrobacter sp. M4]|uniref:GatB/YqeY domain-containing protein n=1 Tax=Arthrobacter sp. M4 TaxID=218160 RepID=UPI001CDB79FF|nr:GatB/YqeY domain-containing protein [Arthrobacter sp. M4]MCA4131480.1 GatB/YqeY domain-containing protein [Arthrobacter sp. M4]